ncbi:stage V sporulation protein B [Clostridium formicaceticum]|uniref:Stage V sporulation protein B n=1 Tax=Clostridium formicaceticum TaxID=1497 RepID=A0AAC9WFM0_9CLOT|nr:stage V sporulation protein B [Clostridium formicaceticum]AOY76634.1 stage V sporulation protein B [Clostridium formicaceticum]ARE87057.1 Stage V sporulation protein B [Clostridium formicaceticum]
MKKSSFIFGTILLALVNVVVRSLGFIYKIFLSRLIGATAIGLYQMVFPFLMVIITIPTAGIPIAVSKLVAKEKSVHHREGIYKVLFLSLLMGGLAAFVLSVFVSLKIDFIVHRLLKNPSLYYPVLWTIPAISIITFSSILRGFFYGLKEMAPAATAQIIEQLCRIIFVLSYLYYKTPSNPVAAATIAIIGISIGEVFGFLYLVLRFNFKKIATKPHFLKAYSDSSLEILNHLLYVAIPITLSRLISVIMQTVNSILIPQRLQVAGYSSTVAIETFGKISGMAMPLLFLPFTVTTALVINIIPNISEQLAVNNWKDVTYKSSLALRMTLLIAIPTTIVYVIFGNHLAELVYNCEEVGKYLSLISYGTIFLCMQHTLSGILHGMGKQVVTTVNYLLGMILQLYCTYFLIPNPKYGIYGYFIGFLLSTFTIFALNLVTLMKYIKIDLPFVHSILKPLLASILMILSMIYSYKAFYSISQSNGWSTIISSFVGAGLYFILLLITKTFDLKHLIETIKD